MADREQQARELMAAIRREVFRPEVTTMGACAKGCGRSARGSGTCADCLAGELDALVGWPTGRQYNAACQYQREAERAVLDAAGGDDGRG